MNSKLLKVCAAFVLIANAGSAMDVTKDDAWFKPSANDVKSSCGDVSLRGDVLGKLTVNWNGNEKELRMYTPLGKITAENERTISFAPNSNGKFELSVELDKNMKFDEDGKIRMPRVTDNNVVISTDTIGIVTQLTGPGVTTYVTGESTKFDCTSIGEFKILFIPDELESGVTKKGQYKGTITIELTAVE